MKAGERMPLQIIREDITVIECDAIVNPTDEYFSAEGGVDAAIHAAAGEELRQACERIGHCNVGDAVITDAYLLPSKYVIHTVGPIWQGGDFNEKKLLESCYEKSLAIAKEKKCETIAFPLISSGTYGYPKDKVLRIAAKVIGDFLADNDMNVFIVVFDKEAYSISEKLFSAVTSFINDNYVEKKKATERRQPKASEYRRLFPREFFPCERKERSKSCECASEIKSLADMLDSLDESFAQMLFRLIDKKGMTDVECYKKANVDKKTFSKIKCNKNYRPSKVTAISFAIALELDIEETDALLRTVGFTLSRSNKFDVIIEFFITNRIYDIYEINETLFKFDQVLLGV